jgi:hypothetical protein
VHINQEVRTPQTIAAIRSSYAEDISTEPSTTEVLNQPVVESNPILSVEVCKQLWEVESKSSFGLNLHQLYEIHWDLLLAMVGIDMGAVMSPEQFQFLWEFCGRYRVENLLVDIFWRGSI